MKIPRRTLIAYLMGLLATGVLATAAFFKAGDPGLFIDQITAHKVTPASWSPFFAYFFVLIELLVAAAFIAFIWPRLVFSGTILMMLGFIGLTAWAWAHGNASHCGCFGRLVERGPLEVIIEDTVVIAVCLVGLFLTRNFKTRPWQWLIGTPLAIIAVILTVFGPQLPIDAMVVGVGPGDELSDIALQGARTPIDQGSVLLVFVGPDCPACNEGIPGLKTIQSSPDGPAVIAAYSGTRAEAQAWRMKTLKVRPNFPIAVASPRVLKQYYRNLPVTFLLKDGIIEKVWWNTVARPEEIQLVGQTTN